MILKKKSVVLANPVTLEFCLTWLHQNITDIKSVTPEITTRCDRWLDSHAEVLYIGETEFKTQLKKLYHKNKKVHYTSKEYWLLRGWTDEEASSKVATGQSSKSKSCLQYYLAKGYSEDEAKVFQSEYQGSTRGKNKARLTTQFGEQKASRLIFERDRKASHRAIDFWIAKGMSQQDAKCAVFNSQTRQPTIETKNKIKRASKRCVEYWINNGLSQDEAIKKVSEHQTTFSLEKCIHKFGKEKGFERWQERQEKWHKSYKKSNYSKVSQRLFMELITVSPDCLFAERYQNGKNNEFVFRTKNGSVYKLDFWSPTFKKVIEFDGDYWHRLTVANPKREARRDAEIISTDPNIEILHIKEIDFRKDPEGTIARCKQFLCLNSKTAEL